KRVGAHHPRDRSGQLAEHQGDQPQDQHGGPLRMVLGQRYTGVAVRWVPGLLEARRWVARRWVAGLLVARALTRRRVARWRAPWRVSPRVARGRWRRPRQGRR